MLNRAGNGIVDVLARQLRSALRGSNEPSYGKEGHSRSRRFFKLALRECPLWVETGHSKAAAMSVCFSALAVESRLSEYSHFEPLLSTRILVGREVPVGRNAEASLKAVGQCTNFC
jgi:hypothetical protein